MQKALENDRNQSQRAESLAVEAIKYANFISAINFCLLSKKPKQWNQKLW